MTRTPLLLSLVAAAALAGCNQSDPVVVGPDDDPANRAPAANGPVELPPSIAASKTYRCKDNSIVSVDWLSDGTTANLRGGEGEPVVQLKAPEAGKPLVADGGYSLTGAADAGSVTLARPGKGSQSCKA
ncbi:MAG: hypothetical protein ACLGHC_07940 [Alphaproteobacteria bacterium]